MQRRLALLVILPLLAIAFVPALYPLDDDALGGAGSLPDVHSHVFSAVTVSPDFSHDLGWTGLTLLPGLCCRLPLSLSSEAETRAPPA